MLSKKIKLSPTLEGRRTASFAALVLSLLLMLLCPAASAQGGLTLLTVDRDSDVLRTVDPITGATLTADASINITVPAPAFVFGANGMAQDPTDGKLYALVRLDLVTGVPHLVRIDDLATGAATDIKPSIDATGLFFADIGFSSDGMLFGVTEESSTTSPKTLFAIDKTTGNTTQPKLLSNTGGGQAIAFSPSDNLVYHASGLNDAVLETLDPGLLLKPAVNLDLSLDRLHEPSSLVFFRGDFFLWADTDAKLFLLNRNGRARFLSNLDHVAAGMAFIGPAPQCPASAPLYGSAHQGKDGPAMLYSVDPTTGVPSLIGPTGFERVGSIAFRADSTLFGAGERMDGSNKSVLVSIEPCTGLATQVGAASASLGIVTDVSVRPSDSLLFAMISGSATMRLATINTSTGVATDKGSTGLLSSDSRGNGIAFDATNTLFLANTEFSSGRTTLSAVDQATGALIGPSTLLSFSVPSEARINALDFQPGSGNLFAAQNNGLAGTAENYLSRVDASTGDVTTVPLTPSTPTQGGLDGIAFRPAAGVVPSADLKIAMLESADPVTAGQMLTYTLTITNLGPEAANGVVVKDSLPPTALRDVMVSTSQGSCSQGIALICSLGTLNFNGSVTITINARVVVSASGSISSTASVGSLAADSNAANNSAISTTSVLTPPSANIAVTSFTHSPDPTPVGKTLVFTIGVRNLGVISATEVSLWLSLSSAKFSFVSASGVSGCAPTSLAIACNLGTLPSGTKTVTVTVVPGFVRSMPVTATVFSSSTRDPDESDNARGAAPLVQVRPRPFTRPGQIPRIP